MSNRPGFFDADERLRMLSAAGDPLERLRAVVDFEMFRPALDTVLERADRSRGGRPPYDAVMMFRILVLQTLYTLSDEQTEYQLRDRLSFMRFAGLALHDPVPDAKTLWLLREQLTRAGARSRLFERFDQLLHELVIAFECKLRLDDEIVIEVTVNTAAIARLMRPFVRRVAIANPLKVRAIVHARIKTDKMDASCWPSYSQWGSCPKSGCLMGQHRCCAGWWLSERKSFSK